MTHTIEILVPLAERIITIDGEEPTTITEFLEINSARDVEPLDDWAIKFIRTMEVGEEIGLGHCGGTVIKRLK